MDANFKIAGLIIWVVIMIIQGCEGRIYAIGSEEKTPAPKVSAGACKYKTYKGTAKIISIQKKEMPKSYGAPSYDSYEVKFSFFPKEEIREAHGKVAGKEYILKLTNSWLPGPMFLEKYNIREGKDFDCFLKVIKTGACSPILFDFPAIDRSDYFESKAK